MSIRTYLATLEGRHQALKQEIHEEQLHPSWDDSKITELKRRKLLLKDQIARLQQDASILASQAKLSATERKRATTRMNKFKASGWYEGVLLSISITKAKPL